MQLLFVKRRCILTYLYVQQQRNKITFRVEFTAQGIQRFSLDRMLRNDIFIY